MKTGQRSVGPAHLRVRQCSALPEHLRAKTREIVSLEVPASKQNQGYATTLMHKVCREADAANITLVLWPQMFGDNIAMSNGQLIGWYSRSFGFWPIQQDPVLMARLPHSTPKILELKPLDAALLKEKHQ